MVLPCRSCSLSAASCFDSGYIANTACNDSGLSTNDAIASNVLNRIACVIHVWVNLKKLLTKQHKLYTR